MTDHRLLKLLMEVFVLYMTYCWYIFCCCWRESESSWLPRTRELMKAGPCILCSFSIFLRNNCNSFRSSPSHCSSAMNTLSTSTSMSPSDHPSMYSFFFTSPTFKNLPYLNIYIFIFTNINQILIKILIN